MLLPLVSVSLIGLLVGAVFAITYRPRIVFFAWSFLGAWGGFIVGAFLGVAIDVIAGTGVWVAILGHLAALLVAVATTQRAGRRSGRLAV